MSTAVAVVLLLAIVAYAVFGGADFGVGFWDLTAGGSERGKIRGMSSSVPSVRCGKPLIAVPGFVLLFVLDQKGLLPEEGVDDEPVVNRPTTQ